MKRKFLVLFSVIFCAAVCTFGVSACDTDGGPQGGGTTDDPAHTHEYSTEWSYDDGEHWHECSCGKKADLNKHDYDDGVCSVCGYEHKHEYKTEVTEATCTDDGIIKYVCYCGHSYTETTEKARGHTPVTDAAVAPTCTKSGLTEGSHCGVCEAVLVAQQTVPANGHTPVTDAAVAPTCTKSGLTEGSHCSVCEAVLAAQHTVPANGHTLVTDAAVAPTCTKSGLTEGSHCSVCHDVLIAQQTVPANGHTPVTDAAAAPTCTKSGLTEGSHCGVCEAVLVAQQTVPANGHTPVTDAAVAPTCTESGLTEGSHCSVCHDVLIAQQMVPANGHTPVTDAAVAPTCTESGLTDGSHCGVCHEVLVAQQTVSAKGHKWIYSDIGGLTHTSTCETCNTVVEGEKHDWDDNRCKACGYDAGGSKGLKYEFTETDGGGYYTVKGIGNCTDKSLVIPAVYNGYPVEQIETVAFEFNKTVTGLKTSAKIGRSAFFGCSNLKTLDLDGCTEIGNGAFVSCYGLEEIYIAASVEKISERAFYDCTNLKTVEVARQSALTVIGKSAFEDCTSINKMILPFVGGERDYTLGNDYFSYIFGEYRGYYDRVPVIDLLILADCEYISDYAFNGCDKLKRVVFTGDGEVVIGSSAFKNCTLLTEVVLPDGLKKIGYNSFANTPLTEITIPAGVTDMGEEVFYDCKSLIIKCKAKAKPEGWNSYWACKMRVSGYYYHPVIWNCDNNDKTEYDSRFVIIKGLLYELKDGNATVASQRTDVSGNVVIPSSVDYFSIAYPVVGVCYDAFRKCDKITGLTVPESVTYIGKYAFEGSSSLKTITVDAENPNYSDKDGILYNKAQTEFIHVPKAIEGPVTVADGITKIPSGVFSVRSSLTEIIIPQSVTTIDSGAFFACACLKRITLPFVGRDIKTDTDTYQYPFGYIFGTSEYTGGRLIEQKYYGYPDNDGNPTLQSGKYYIPESLRTVTITGGNILYGAFYGCDCVQNVFLPEGITSIPDDAFYGFASLKKITIPESVETIGHTVFYDCTSLESLALPEGLKSIGYSFISGCASLKNLYIGGELSYSGGWDNLLEKCTALESIEVSENNADYCSIGGILYKKEVTEIIYVPRAIKGIVRIPETITDIGRKFYGRSLTSVFVPSGVTELKQNAFEECTSLTRAELPEGLLSIGTQAFYNCNSLKYITIPSTVTEIKLYAFGECSSITEISIPAGVQALDNAAFYQCSALESVTFKNGLESIGFQTFIGCVSLKSVTLPDSVTSVDHSAFQECEALESITVSENNTAYFCQDGVLYNKEHTQFVIVPDGVKGVVSIPDGITAIPAAAFWKRSNLTCVTIPEGVTEIGERAFYECSSLESITIPETVAYIGEYAFWHCNALKNLTVLSKDITVESGAFLGCNSVENATAPSIVFERFLESNGVDAKESIKTAVITCGDTVSGFNSCTSLTSVYIADTVTSIGVYAFRKCSAIESFTFGGTVEQWRAISKGSNWSFESSIFIVHCSDGDTW